MCKFTGVWTDAQPAKDTHITGKHEEQAAWSQLMYIVLYRPLTQWKAAHLKSMKPTMMITWPPFELLFRSFFDAIVTTITPIP